MNKNFFKIRNKIKVIELLGILDVNQEEFFEVNEKIDNIKNIFVDEFVSFSNLKKDKLSFLTSKIKNFSNPASGVCIVQREHLNLLNEQVIKIPFKYPKKGFSIILEKYFTKFHLKNRNYTVHPTAFIHKTAKIGNNVFVGAYSHIDEGVVIEDDTFISERVSISYNCIIGKECFLGVGTVI